MAKLIPAAERVVKARALVQKALDLPAPAGAGADAFAYVARVRDLLRQARDLVKLIPYSPNATPEIKKEVAQILADADQAQKELKA